VRGFKAVKLLIRLCIWAAVAVAVDATAHRLSAGQAPRIPPGAYADIPGVRLWYVDSGGTGTPVVFLHAATGTTLAWEYQVQPFVSAGYRFIAYDRRGHGRSVIDKTAPQPGTAADDLEALMKHLRIDRFHVVGTAAGGIASLDYALAFPQRLRSLVVANSIGGVQDEDYLALGRRIRPAPQFDALPADFRELGPSYRAANPEGTRRWNELERLSHPDGSAPAPPATKNRLTFERLETIKTPTLLMTGDADLWAPPALMRLFAARIKQAETAIVPESGHSAYWEQPDTFNRLVLAFIGKH
jgi:pimeloyl-ACP methyl ester carboxylesterase